MICRTLDLVNLSPSSQFYASDDDSADYSGDDAMLSDLFAQTQETSEDTLVDDTAAPSHASAAEDDDTTVPSHASAVADVASGVSEDPYCDAAETVGPMKTSCVDEEDVDFFKRQVELSDDDDDSDKEYELLL